VTCGFVFGCIWWWSCRIGEDGIEGVGELGVPVADQQTESLTVIVYVHEQVPGRLRHPGAGRMPGAEQVDVAGGDLHCEEHIDPLQEHGVDSESISSSVCLSGSVVLQDGDGFDEVAGLAGAAAEFSEDAPGFELGVRAFAGST
jgi:hypothetical protein